ncbi:hypothetical protein AC579_4909 [Pseudocercospora musae]|uniref:Uncharacterized protein n=1 Tax=Pseudocercospora musae TaxID=113226 RepID=A0A139IER8_9PEZI|nr:hypothetical protein AC579_4909 [Pseudocercospora musae]
MVNKEYVQGYASNLGFVEATGIVDHTVPHIDRHDDSSADSCSLNGIDRGTCNIVRKPDEPGDYFGTPLRSQLMLMVPMVIAALTKPNPQCYAWRRSRPSTLERYATPASGRLRKYCSGMPETPKEPGGWLSP